VLRGRRPGLYGTWEECERETSGFKSSEHYSFSSGVLALEQALAHWRLKKWRVAITAPSTPATDPALASLSSVPLRTPPSSSRPSDHSPVLAWDMSDSIAAAGMPRASVRHPHHGTPVAQPLVRASTFRPPAVPRSSASTAVSELEDLVGSTSEGAVAVSLRTGGTAADPWPSRSTLCTRPARCACDLAIADLAYHRPRSTM
jgi:hypothetical protein